MEGKELPGRHGKSRTTLQDAINSGENQITAEKAG